MVRYTIILLLNVIMHLYCFKYGNLPAQGLRILNGDADTLKLDFVVRIDTLKAFTIKNWLNGTTQIVEKVCTGSIISPSWVLTAAHCVLGAGKIRYGDTSGKTTKTSKVLRLITHPKWYISLADDIVNDIGLLQVEKIKLPIRPGQLSAADYKSLIGYPMKIAGYGLNAMKESEKNYESPLQLADVMSIKCSEKISGPTICVSPRCDKYQTHYYGDSGGPLLLDGKIVGVTSQIINYQMIDCPVSPYITWIRKIIQMKL